jgi:ABC-type transport system substrate-binding protein
MSLVNTTDGPWHLTSFNAAAGTFTLDTIGTKSNPVREVSMLPCATVAACYNLVIAGKADVALADSQSLPTLLTPLHATTVRNTTLTSHGLSLRVLGPASVNAIVLNNASTSGTAKQTGVELANPVVRQALQLSLDQSVLGTQLYHQWSLPATSVLSPIWPSTASAAIRHAQTSTAIALLEAHGWQVKAGTTTTCTRPGITATTCGAGISAGATLSFSLDYVQGPARDTAMTTLQREWAAIGVALTLHPLPLATAELDVYDHLAPWDMVWFGSGLHATLKPYPSFEDYLSTNGTATAGSPPAFDGTYLALTSGTASLAAAAGTLSAGAPLLYLPTPLVTYVTRGSGITVNSLGTIAPETWHH